MNLLHNLSDVIKDFVLEEKDKAKDMEPEDEDKDLRPILRPRPKNQGQNQLHLKNPTGTTQYRQLGWL